MKKVIIMLLVVVIMTATFVPVYAANEWMFSHYGDKDGAGIGAYPGNTFDWMSLPDVSVGEGITDFWFCGNEADDVACWSNATMSGFPDASVIKAAQMSIAHGGYLEGYVYIMNGDDSYMVGQLTPSQDETNFMVEDRFDLTPFKKLLKRSEVNIFIAIPRLGGTFGIDNGVIDWIEIQAFGH